MYLSDTHSPTQFSESIRVVNSVGWGRVHRFCTLLEDQLRWETVDNGHLQNSKGSTSGQEHLDSIKWKGNSNTEGLRTLGTHILTTKLRDRNPTI